MVLSTSDWEKKDVWIKTLNDQLHDIIYFKSYESFSKEVSQI